MIVSVQLGVIMIIIYLIPSINIDKSITHLIGSFGKMAVAISKVLPKLKLGQRELCAGET